jgi:hypothetical protein
MIAFTPLVIEPNYSLSVNDIDSSVFVNVSARRHRLGHPPNDELENRPIWVDVFKTSDQFGGHVGNVANNSVRCQSRQHPRGGVSNFLYRQGVTNKGANKGKQRENKGKIKGENKGTLTLFFALTSAAKQSECPFVF